MKIIIVGLGSMGRRRIRNLRQITGHEVAGFDLRADRRSQVETEYDIKTFSSLEEVQNLFRPEAVIVSTSPESHGTYMAWAAQLGLHCFVEASVSGPAEAEALVQLAQGARGIMVPSCTMVYTDAVVKLKDVVAAHVIGRPLIISYHVGQYLPDWHPWERVEDYYVSNRDTGGCREIVPFEITWLRSIFGQPKPLYCNRGRLGDIPVDIDDFYHVVLEFPRGLICSVTIEVLSRPRATREFRLVGTEGQASFDNESMVVESVEQHPLRGVVNFVKGEIEPGYIYPEGPYVRELKDFLDAVENNDASRFPSSFQEDLQVLQLLNDLESMTG